MAVNEEREHLLTVNSAGADPDRGSKSGGSGPVWWRSIPGGIAEQEKRKEAVAAKVAQAEMRRGASFAGACGNFIKGMLGAGILSTPFAFSEAGLWLGFISFPILWIFITSAMLLLVRTKREANLKAYGDYYQGPVITYMDIGRQAHPFGGYMVLFCVVLMQLCFCTGWVIVMANNLHSMIPWVDYRFETAWLFPALVLLSWIPFIKQFVYTSYFGLAVYVFGVMGVSYYYGIPQIPDNFRNTVGFNFTTLPLFLTNVLYALGGYNGLVGCESTLQEPRNAKWLVLGGLSVYGLAVLLFGSLMYMSGLGRCTIVLDCLPDNWASYTVKSALTLALLFTHPLGLSYGVELLEDALFPPSTSRVVRCLVRTILVAVTCIVGALVPDFSLFSSFVGGALLPFCGFILPSFLFFRLTGVRPTRLLSWDTLVCLFLAGMLLFGVAFVIIGVYTATVQVL
eukprot:TRINITY_DN3705_c0_g1_i1.p1 TRINITY_DN3705_c0_g1~~TRINITY_DN3705_c0_g1_i1.p1  ORF type:complete len:465 (+),score=108.32 TRINITY_DN3705_c0_g1_i1:34-1395(+)